MSKIVVNQGALGDLLLSLPAIRLLRKFGGDFTLAANPESALMLKRAGEVSSVLPVNAAGFHQLYSGTVPAILGYFKEFWWFSRRRGLVPEVLLRPDYQPECRVIFTVDESSESKHCALFQFQQVARELGVQGEEFGDYLYPITLNREQTSEQVGQTGGPEGESSYPSFAAAIHPGSGSYKKNWPVERFISLADKILQEGGAGTRVLFFLGPADEDPAPAVREYIERMNKGIPARELQLFLSDNLPLEQAAALLDRCRSYFGNDSGMTHLAAWLGIKTVALFGPTDPALWAPPHPWVQVVKSSAQCSPCGDKYRDCTDPFCMDMIPF